MLKNSELKNGSMKRYEEVQLWGLSILCLCKCTYISDNRFGAQNTGHTVSARWGGPALRDVCLMCIYLHVLQTDPGRCRNLFIRCGWNPRTSSEPHPLFEDDICGWNVPQDILYQRDEEVQLGNGRSQAEGEETQAVPQSVVGHQPVLRPHSEHVKFTYRYVGSG